MKTLFFKKIFDVSKWMLSRSGTVYVVLFLTSSFFININGIWGNARIRSMNRIMPLFDELAGHVVHNKPLTDEQWKEYSAYYRTIANLIPSDAGPYFFLGYCQIFLGKNNEALVNFQKAVDKAPGIFWFEYNLALMYYKNGDYEKAGYFFQRSIRAGDAPARLYMLHSMLYKQVLVSALQIGFNPQESFNRSFSQAYVMAADCLYRTKNYDQAIETAYAALSKDLGQSEDLYYSLAASLKELGRTQEMISVLQLLLNQHPDYAGAWELLLDFFSTMSDQKNMAAAKIKLEQLRREGKGESRAMSSLKFHLM